jgi:hypothetical protein
MAISSVTLVVLFAMWVHHSCLLLRAPLNRCYPPRLTMEFALARSPIGKPLIEFGILGALSIGWLGTLQHPPSANVSNTDTSTQLSTSSQPLAGSTSPCNAKPSPSPSPQKEPGAETSTLSKPLSGSSLEPVSLPSPTRSSAHSNHPRFLRRLHLRLDHRLHPQPIQKGKQTRPQYTSLSIRSLRRLS